jgi:ribosomal protein RSM22 (predicted rRNA methylase)
MAAALTAVKERAPRFTPARLLDVGAGPGTASWAAAETWPQLESVTMLDRNLHLLAAARTLAGASPNTALRSAEITSADLATFFGSCEKFLPSSLVGEGGRAPCSGAMRTEGGAASAGSATSRTKFDLILAGYTFAELPAQTRDRVLTSLWNACSGALVIVEPGTPAGFATILACRTALIASGARVVAPCPGAHPCSIAAPHWCHFAERLPRSRAHMRAKDASVPFEDEKFSYIAAARDGIEIAPIEARILALPHATKPGVRLKLCTASGLADRVVLKRDEPAYKAVSRKSWGDAL